MMSKVMGVFSGHTCSDVETFLVISKWNFGIYLVVFYNSWQYRICNIKRSISSMDSSQVRSTYVISIFLGDFHIFYLLILSKLIELCRNIILSSTLRTLQCICPFHWFFFFTQSVHWKFPLIYSLNGPAHNRDFLLIPATSLSS